MKQLSKQLKLPAELDKLDSVISFLETTLWQCDCPMKIMTQICVSVEEIFVNIANYAYPDNTGECHLDLSVDYEAEAGCNQMTLCIHDAGKAFNPLEKEDPDITLCAEDRQIGGLGIWMVKQSMDQVKYRYEDEKNILTLTKTW
nr:ATP-binding protein [Lachnospiraceae bacterium]